MRNAKLRLPVKVASTCFMVIVKLHDYLSRHSEFDEKMDANIFYTNVI
jgi:hypothetical protein